MRFKELDSLRGLLSLCVLCHHSGLLFPSSYVAVDIFFMLSGFVLTHRYNQGISFRSFCGERLRKLLPPHLLVLIAIILFVLLSRLIGKTTMWDNELELGPHGIGSILFIWDSLLLSNLYVPPPPYNSWGLNGVSWSLSLELWVGPVLLFFVGTTSRRARMIATFVGLIVFLWLFWTRQHLHGVKEVNLVVLNDGILRATAGFLVGNVSYRSLPRLLRAFDASSQRLARTIATAAELVIICWVLWIFLNPTGMPTDFFIVIAAPCLILIFAAGRGLVSNVMRLRLLGLLGELSFGIYLVHQPLLRAMASYGVPWQYCIIAIFPLSILAAALLAFVVSLRSVDQSPAGVQIAA